MAAKVGVTETTIEPASFAHPTKSKIQFWDLPGIGTPNYPDLETYCETVKLEKYDTFLIFSAGRFTENDLKLARKIRSVNKMFFFIRSKIDENVRAEKRKLSFNEDIMLNDIRRDCSEKLAVLVEDIQYIFLISNHHPTKWDFVRLTEAIFNFLPLRQEESFNLSLGVLTSLIQDILQRKIQLLKSRMWTVSSACFLTGILSFFGISAAVARTLIVNEITYYRSHLGLPEEGSAEFLRLNVDNQERMRKFCRLTAEDEAEHMAAYSTEETSAEAALFIRFGRLEIAETMSFDSMYRFLQHALKELEEIAMIVLDDITGRLVDDFDIAG